MTEVDRSSPLDDLMNSAALRERRFLETTLETRMPGVFQMPRVVAMMYDVDLLSCIELPSTVMFTFVSQCGFFVLVFIKGNSEVLFDALSPLKLGL